MSVHAATGNDNKAVGRGRSGKTGAGEIILNGKKIRSLKMTVL
jgi:hypothetical protein